VSLQATRDESATLTDVIGRVLDKGLVINADICVSVAGVELLGIKIRAALASFDTAARYGLEFPSGTNLNTAAWKEAEMGKEACPQCGKKTLREELINEGCPWCGWLSAKAKRTRTGLVSEIPVL
jgi:ribosomal protein L37AE/L43A